MSIRSLLLSVAAESGLSLDEAASALHQQVDSAVSQYRHESETFQSACDTVLSENPSITKEALIPMVAMAVSKNPADFPATLRSVGEFVDLTYVGKRGRRKEGDNSPRLSKRG